MLRYEKIDVSEGIDVNKTSASKECELCHYWFFKDVGFKFEEHVCNKYHDLLTMAYSLKNIAILSAKEVTFRCLLMGISKNKSLKRLNRSIVNMNFNPSKTPIEIIKKGAFDGAHFRDIYSGINEKWYKNSRKEFVHLKNIDAKFYASDYYDVNVNKYGVKCGTSLRFWENKGWINKKILMVGFSGILGIGQVEDQKMIKDKLIDGKKL